MKYIPHLFDVQVATHLRCFCSLTLIISSQTGCPLCVWYAVGKHCTTPPLFPSPLPCTHACAHTRALARTPINAPSSECNHFDLILSSCIRVSDVVTCCCLAVSLDMSSNLAIYHKQVRDSFREFCLETIPVHQLAPSVHNLLTYTFSFPSVCPLCCHI